MTGLPQSVLVTGGAGYVGSCLVRRLATGDGPERSVRILDVLQRGDGSALMHLPAGATYEFHHSDILDPAALRRALHDVDAVVHLAAVVSTPFSFDRAAAMRHVNHWGTARLVEEAVAAGVKRLVYVSSASVYGPGVGFPEDSKCHPMGPYSEAKLAGERVALAASARMDVRVLRLGMVYGLAPCMRYDAVPNRFAFLAATGCPVPLFGGGDQIRPVVHVEDAVSAVLWALGSPPSGEVIFNVASENLTVAAMAGAVQGLRPFVRIIPTDQDVRTRLSLGIETTRLRQLGWRPEVTLERGLGELLAALGPFAAHPPTHHPSFEF